MATRQSFNKLFGASKKCRLIGMVHVGPLPGTPLFRDNVDKLASTACRQAETYMKNGVNGILVENMHDLPYVQSKHFGPEITATMARICTDIRKIVPESYPCGIQVLACGGKEALAIAKACSLNFIRIEGYVFGHIADEGYTDANAGTLLRYRSSILAQEVLVFADIKKKHCSHAITTDVSLVDTAKAAEFFLADGLILTGKTTGDPASVSEFNDLLQNTRLPVLIGSGVTEQNLQEYSKADALIVGSYFKKDGVWWEEIDEARVKKFMERKRNLLREI